MVMPYFHGYAVGILVYDRKNCISYNEGCYKSTELVLNY